MLGLLAAQSATPPIHALRRRLTRSAVAASGRQAAMTPKREGWIETDVLALPAGEHDYFDRKSGLVFEDTERLKGTLAKAVSAFANSGGGHMVLGVDDGGTIDGVPPLRGSTRAREWLEQTIPN